MFSVLSSNSKMTRAESVCRMEIASDIAFFDLIHKLSDMHIVTQWSLHRWLYRNALAQ